MRLTFLLVITLILGPRPLRSQQEAAVLGNPFNTRADVAAGQTLYASECVGCHGRAGEGGRGPALNQGRFRRASTDEEVYKLISTGVSGTEMPGFSFNGRQMWQTIAFIRSLGASRPVTVADGDRAKGEELFFGKGACTNCHMIRGRGGRVGPDLSRIGPQRSLGQFEASILRPNEEVLPQNQQVRVTRRNGEKVVGRRMNEDTFSLQILEGNQKLLSLRKDDIAAYEVIRDSPMPSYQDTLSETELKNLIAFLAGLGR
jgi:cytochrome c oxidase cbb3-type subunit 3